MVGGDDAAGEVRDAPAALLPQLAAHLERRPRDARAWAIYARLLSDHERFAEAAGAYAQAVALPGKVALDPGVWCEYADTVGMMQGGKLAGRPRALIDRALAINARHPRALELAGSAEYEQGNFAGALHYWEPLLEILPPQSERSSELALAVERTRIRAGM